MPPRTHHDLQCLLDTITDEVTIDSSLDLHLLEAGLQGDNDIRHSHGGLGRDFDNLIVAFLGSGQAAEGWVVQQFHPHLQEREGPGQVREGPGQVAEPGQVRGRLRWVRGNQGRVSEGGARAGESRFVGPVQPLRADLLPP